MKAFTTVVAFLCLCVPTWAYGKRGAAERAMFFMVYLQQEVFLDASQRTVASGCTGTRTGIRGQTGRCTLAEFVDFIWKMDPDNPQIAHPDKTLIQWPATMKETKLNAANIDPAKWTTAIHNNIRIKKSEPGKKDKYVQLPGHGYTGPFDANKLLNGGTWTYYSALSEFGKLAKVAGDEYNKIQASLTGDEKAYLKRANLQISPAVDLSYYLRLKDKWDALWDRKKGNAVAVLGFTPITNTANAPDSVAGAVGSWQEMDTSKTIAWLVKFRDLSFKEAQAFFYDKWERITEGQAWKDHAAALESSFENKRGLGC
ncbi:hypothetical protein GQ53DRAFT_821806 [Thozetella sp. PMI_491]|nr:hypothetical protein GQ53DRAFT_821806 [Thozetella sp. PMI_491]